MTRWAAFAIASVGALTLGTLERIIASHLNPLRAELGVPPFRKINEFYLVADLVLAFTAEPFEYPRSDWSAKVRLVGPGLWEPPAEAPAWLREVHRPLVLVTCSTLFQNDRKIAQIACEAFDGEPLDVVITTVEIDPASFIAPANVRIERFVPHSPVLDRAACVVCHAGMGITQKALAHGVPVVAVPFGRDQPEVSRRVEVARAGVRLPARKLTPARLRAAVREAIEAPTGSRTHRRSLCSSRRTDSRGGRARTADGRSLDRNAIAAPRARGLTSLPR